MIQDERIHHFHRRRAMLQNCRRGPESIQQLVELNGQDSLGFGEPHEPQLGFEHHAQSPFRTHHQLR